VEAPKEVYKPGKAPFHLLVSKLSVRIVMDPLCFLPLVVDKLEASGYWGCTLEEVLGIAA
jgi:hypothetical protein